MPVTLTVVPGRCLFCACTADSPCNAAAHALHAAPGIEVATVRGVLFCGWANDDHTCCTVCDAVLKRLAELPEFGYQRAIALTDETREALRVIRNG